MPPSRPPCDEQLWYPISRAGAALRSVVAAVFVLVGGAMMFAPTLVSGVFPAIPVIIVGGVCVVYFGMVLVVLAAPSVIRPGGILITPEGIAFHSGFFGFSAQWRDIEQVRMARSGLLGFRAAEGRLLDLRGLQRLQSPAQWRLWGVHAAIPLQTLRIEPAIVETVQRHHGAAGA